MPNNMSEFLENLKKAADTGEFNSEAAKKILKVSQLANTKLGAGTPEDLEKLKESLEKRYSKGESVGEKKAVELNSEYDKKMAAIKKYDAVNRALATLMNIEDMVKASVEDMFSYVREVENGFSKELSEKDPVLEELATRLKELRNKYNPIIN